MPAGGTMANKIFRDPYSSFPNTREWSSLRGRKSWHGLSAPFNVDEVGLPLSCELQLALLFCILGASLTLGPKTVKGNVE